MAYIKIKSFFAITTRGAVKEGIQYDFFGLALEKLVVKHEFYFLKYSLEIIPEAFISGLEFYHNIIHEDFLR